MNKKSVFEFTVVLAGIDEDTPGLEDALFEVGCDDALINFRNGTVYIDFSREGLSVEKTVISAVRAVESASIGARVVNILPDDLVSESEIAKRLNKNRQTISLWVKKKRRHHTEAFPTPIAKLSEKSPMWSWFEVVSWLYRQKLISDENLLESAKFIGHLNSVLGERDPAVKKYRHQILRKLSS